MKNRIVEIGRDSAWYLIAMVASAFISFIAVPILTRIFDPGEYGVYALVSTSIMLASPLFFDWVSNAVIRFYPEYQNRGELDVFFTTVMHKAPYFLLFVFGVALPVSVIFLPLGEYRLLVGLGVAVFGLYTLFRVQLGIMRARQMAWQYAFFMVFISFGRFIVGAALVSWFGMGVEGPFYGWLGALLLAIPVELLMLKLWKYMDRRKFSKQLQSAFVRYGLPLILVTIFSEVLTAADRYMVQGFRGTFEVGLYSVVYTLVMNLEAILASVITLGAVPVVFKVYVNDGERVTVALVNRLTRYFLMVLVPAMFSIYILRYRIISVIASPQYMRSVSAVLPLTAGIFLSNIMWLPFLSFKVKKKTKVTLVPMGCGAAANIIFNFILIPRFGFVGAAWATLISYAISITLVIVMARRYMRWMFPWGETARIVAAAALMSAFLIFASEVVMSGWAGLAVLILAGAFIYGLLLLLLGGFSKTELKHARLLFVRIKERLLRPFRRGKKG